MRFVLSDALCDEWRESGNAEQCVDMFSQIFGTHEQALVHEQHVTGCESRFETTDDDEAQFVEALSKCTDFFHSKIVTVDVD